MRTVTANHFVVVRVTCRLAWKLFDEGWVMSRILVQRSSLVGVLVLVALWWLGRSATSNSDPAAPVGHDAPTIREAAQSSPPGWRSSEPGRLDPQTTGSSPLSPRPHQENGSAAESGDFTVRQVGLALEEASETDTQEQPRLQYITQQPNNNGPTIRWPYARSTRVHLITADQVVLEGKGTKDGDQIVIQRDGEELDRTPATEDNRWSANIDDLGDPGPRNLVVQITRNGETVARFPFTLNVPVQDPDVLRLPVISHASNNQHQPLEALSETINCYGGYLQLSGRNVDEHTQLDFGVYQKVENQDVFEFREEFLRPSRRVVPTADGRWTTELMVGGRPNETGLLLARITDERTPGRHRFSSVSADQRVNYQFFPEDDWLEIPVAPTLNGKTPAEQPLKTDSPEITVSGTIRRRVIQPPVTVDNNQLFEDSRVVILLGRAQERLEVTTPKEDGTAWTWQATIQVPQDGRFEVRAAAVVGNVRGNSSPPASFELNRSAFRAIAADLHPSEDEITVRFNREIYAWDDDEEVNEANVKDQFTLKGSADGLNPTSVTRARDGRSVTLEYDAIPPDLYTLTVQAGTLQDLFGNKIEEYETTLHRAIDAPIATAPGLQGQTGRYVEYPEYTQPRRIIEGFNPSDHVQTRVARLYYFRDAHRVAQIINREARSHNRARVDMQHQQADMARRLAEQATNDRRFKERRAVEAAQGTRRAEAELQQVEYDSHQAAIHAANAAQDLRRVESRLGEDDADQDASNGEVARLRQVIQSTDRVAETNRQRAARLRNQVQSLRDTESQLHEQWQASIAAEDRFREDQFRREVAAAHEDPDTYAEGHPTSEDPVRQVSVSVIGEGLLQLRGPIKGVNIIRTMINQIDAPVGQVNVGVHTVQINGERGDRMEKVANRIQRYIDHSRFLTMQSAEMLRRAVVEIAAQKAMQAGTLPGQTQDERDRKYLYSFFGEDFTNELATMDSEFLKTGNKLLSLHSMDTTSLASALFLMALANNTTRMEILHRFEQLMLAELPLAEKMYFQAGLAGSADGSRHRRFHGEEFLLMSQNARFQSLRGFFDTELIVDNTMTPLQHEFIRLAQIFKSQLIVEMELRQRIMERAVIEERLSDREKELWDARERENAANQQLEKADKARQDAQKSVLAEATRIQARIGAVRSQTDNAQQAANRQIQLVDEMPAAIISYILGTFTVVPISETTEAGIREYIDHITPDWDQNKRETAVRRVAATIEKTRRRLRDPLRSKESLGKRIREVIDEFISTFEDAFGDAFKMNVKMNVKATSYSLAFTWERVEVTMTIDPCNEITLDQPSRDLLQRMLRDQITVATRIYRELGQFQYDRERQRILDSANKILRDISKPVDEQADGELLDNLQRAMEMFQLYVEVAQHVAEQASSIDRMINLIVADFGDPEAEAGELYSRWLQLEDELLPRLGPKLAAEAKGRFAETGELFRRFINANLEYEFARRQAEAARRPLDHKKFLDMLVDEMEDKYIELLEGTRAHTANIDGYLKRLMTALDDDFNTQFYHPAFRQVRQASRAWDVTLGQVETTSLLVNNRGFGKVQPQATMEFDLPRRNILLAEAMDGAKAMVDDFGALAQDPTFLAMAQMNAGQPTSSPGFGATGGLATVRNVLPGLSTETGEQVLAQHGPGRTSFGAALEGLIPDPAIYKFETGTGFEIRPVIQPDGQAVVFGFDYMYTTNIREPVRADEKHLGRVKRHFINTDVQLSNYELREVSRYTVALKAARTARGVPLLEDIPYVGVLFRPLPSAESSLQQNVILAQSTIFPTLFDLMGLRWAPAVADLDPLTMVNDEFIVRNRRRALMNRVFDHSSSEVDRFLRIPEGERRMDLYRSQQTIPSVHPDGYFGPGAGLQDSHLQEGYSPQQQPPTPFVPGADPEGSPRLRRYDRREHSHSERDERADPEGNPRSPPESLPRLQAPTTSPANPEPGEVPANGAGERSRNMPDDLQPIPALRSEARPTARPGVPPPAGRQVVQTQYVEPVGPEPYDYQLTCPFSTGAAAAAPRRLPGVEPAWNLQHDPR